jgi:hypothetical protein
MSHLGEHLLDDRKSLLGVLRLLLLFRQLLDTVRSA